MSEPTQTPYAGLSPDLILDAIESTGHRASGGLLALNSYENRVYQIELEDESFVVAKFYRPNRWSDEQILEEHQYVQELTDYELPCVAPLSIDGQTLFEYQGFRIAIYPRQGGHAPNIEVEENLIVLARTLGRIHAVGRTRPFKHRVALTSQRMASESRAFLLAQEFLPPDMIEAYSTITQHLIERIEPQMAGINMQRIHGDCHLGNLLWRNDTPHFVDFDDCVSGPAIQDLWMLLSGERVDQQVQMGIIIDAYEPFCSFNPVELRLIEPLRTLRIMHQAAWLARRWVDPAFPLAFPWFNTQKYWAEHILNLREQQAALDEPPLVV
ncbi:MAG: serine/threonine protein kinase [Proteobacteria bacterium]|nr:serine/threonine protein kinase [Pseudomonadota bacterium]